MHRGDAGSVRRLQHLIRCEHSTPNEDQPALGKLDLQSPIRPWQAVTHETFVPSKAERPRIGPRDEDGHADKRPYRYSAVSMSRPSLQGWVEVAADAQLRKRLEATAPPALI